MLPVQNFYTLRESLSEVRKAGARVCGVFLYIEANHAVMRFMKEDGLFNLDAMISNSENSDFGMFSFEPVDAGWLRHAQDNNNLWWRVFGNGHVPPQSPPTAPPMPTDTLDDLQIALRSTPQSVEVSVGERKTMSMSQLLDNDWSKHARSEYNRRIAVEVGYFFDVPAHELPGVALFTNLKQRQFKWVELRHIQTDTGVLVYFSKLFDSHEFKMALQQVVDEYGYS